eukprot:4585024-Pyramimonas_sp.AAC.1
MFCAGASSVTESRGTLERGLSHFKTPSVGELRGRFEREPPTRHTAAGVTRERPKGANRADASNDQNFQHTEGTFRAESPFPDGGH